MKERLENIFDDIADTEYEIKCFIDLLNIYKDYCYLNDNIEWENNFVILIKTVAAIHKDIQQRLLVLDDLIKEL